MSKYWKNNFSIWSHYSPSLSLSLSLSVSFSRFPSLLVVIVSEALIHNPLSRPPFKTNEWFQAGIQKLGFSHTKMDGQLNNLLKGLRGFVCTYHPTAQGSNPKHTIYAFSICIIYVGMRKGRK